MARKYSTSRSSAVAEDTTPFSGGLSKERQAAYATSPKRAVNLRIQAALIDDAKALRINLSEVFAVALRASIAKAEGEVWARENAGAIEAYNEDVRTNGLWSDELRPW